MEGGSLREPYGGREGKGSDRGGTYLQLRPHFHGHNGECDGDDEKDNGPPLSGRWGERRGVERREEERR